MSSSEITLLLVLIVLLLLSAFFSSAETAFITVSNIKIRSLIEEGNKKAILVNKIIENKSKMLSAILIGNNLVNITASALATLLAQKMFGEYAISFATGILTILVLIFGEITPKSLATINALKLSLAYAKVIYGIMYILTPFIFVLNFLANSLMRLLGVNPDAKTSSITETELRTIVDVSHEEGVIEKEEKQMINNVFDFGDAIASDVMVPKVDMTMADINSTYDELIQIFRKEKYTRIPIYQDTTDNVIGIINMKDLLLYNPEHIFDIRNYLRSAFYTYEGKKISELMMEMKKTSVNIVIVLDEYGVTAGLITLEDLIEEIVGEIRDEYDTDEIDDITRLSDREYLVLGSANLEDVSDELNLHLESDDYDTIGGYCLEKLDHLPERNEIIITDDDVLLRIEAVDKNRIEKVYIKLPEPSAED